MNSRDRKLLRQAIASEVMATPGVLARVYIKRNYSATVPYEDICVWYAKSDGSESEKCIHLATKTIYDTPREELAKRITAHLQL